MMYTNNIITYSRPPSSGRFSPENINQALNQTRIAAIDYYNQFHKKVDAYAKLKWF